MDSESLHHSVVALVERLTEQIDDPHGLGFMSPAIYDTAWVSMVSKTVEEQTVWLFPECFEYILQNQQEDGSWITYASQIDGILNTAASLLSLKRHFDHPHQIAPINSERIQRATEALQALLNSWNVGTTLHVGFEILVPALLDYLAAEGISFAFPSREQLFEIRQQKLARFRAEYLYLPIKTTALHSLEAFIGSVNFDQVSHHKVNGALMASPSSTAAFLMHASQWDDECEVYLRHTIEFASGRGAGGVPSAFPSTIFEVTWSLSTLLKCGFDLDLTKLDAVQKARTYLYNALTAEKGVVGFTPHVGADADDTAKAILVLHLLQHPFSCDAMLKEFEADHHFRTYPQERDPSFSANCNVLLALLHTPDPSQFATQIEKATRFLHAHFTDSKLEVRDKWNLSPYYSWMLMTQAIIRLQQLWNNDQLQSLPCELFTEDLPVLLSDMALAVLRQGNPNGSWGTRNSKEETAYAVLILTYAAHFELTHESHREIRKATEAGCSYLLDKSVAGSERLWVEKVTYESEILSQTYVLAALKNAASLLLEEPEPVKVNSTNGHHVESNGVDWTLVQKNGEHANGMHVNGVGHVNGNNGVHLNGERHDEAIHNGESLAVPLSTTIKGIHLNEDEHHEHNPIEESDSESGSVGTNGTSKSQYQRQDWTTDQEQILLGPFDYLENLPGKNMRSQFIQAFNQWLQVPTESLEVVEKVTKMLHTASLLVDDIEDNSDLRRGNPVAHRLFGTAQTFNSGNYVYFLALREIQKLQNPQAINIYAESLIDLHRGQGMDLFWRDSLVCPTQDEYLDMVANKTGGLFCLAIQLMQAESEVQTDFVPLVRLLGIIFQICDDYLNLKSTAYTHNKGLCEDLTEGKFSFPIIHSIRANPGNRQLINILKQKPHEEDIKRHALACMELTNTFEYTRQFVNILKAEALEMIEMFESQGLGVNVGIRKILARMSLDPQ